jgi:preprotein translocase subunit YajC
VEAASLLPIVAIALLFWLLLIRPASKRQKDLARMQSALRPGDEVMLGAGIFATVVGIDDERARVHVEVSPGTRLEVARGAIAQVVDQAAPADELDDPPHQQPGEQGPREDS